MALRLRVGLNSGRVIAGDIGSGSLGYAATGETVGFAQRMESAAPPGEVMLSEATARLVEHTVKLAEPEWVHVKGADEPVSARRLLADQAAAMTLSGAPNPGWSVGAGKWPPSTPSSTAQSVTAAVS